MKIIVDCDIPYINGVFEPYADVRYIKGAEMSASDVRDADVLIVRTRTRCDDGLLGGSTVKMIATATIGLDHIDLNYCAQNGIKVCSAAGSNARAVAQWVFAAMKACRAEAPLGIIGVGNVGREVEAMAAERGIEVLRCDPPRAALGEEGFIELDELLRRSNTVTVHVPLLPTTERMINSKFLETMRTDALLLNSSRGEVADEQAMIESVRVRYAIDVWRDEPLINLQMLHRAAIATPHIAGYSARGKARATKMVITAVAQFLGIDQLIEWQSAETFELEQPESFDIIATDRKLRESITTFENQRLVRSN